MTRTLKQGCLTVLPYYAQHASKDVHLQQLLLALLAVAHYEMRGLKTA